MGRGLWAMGFKRCAARHCVVIGALGALRCARLMPAKAASEQRETAHLRYSAMSLHLSWGYGL